MAMTSIADMSGGAQPDTIARGSRPLEADKHDEAPNAKAIPAERQAQMLVRPYQGKVAWLSVALSVAILLSFIAVCWLAVTHLIPLWGGLIFNTAILYASQTPLHEACHGNIAGRDSSLMWLNHAIGYACGAILLHDYKAFRALHLMHHRDTNDEEFDPDHWVKVKNPLLVLWRCLTIVPYYNHYFFKMVVFRPEVPGNKKLTMQVIASYWILYSVALALRLWLLARGSGAMDRPAYSGQRAHHLLLRLSDASAASGDRALSRHQHFSGSRTSCSRQS